MAIGVVQAMLVFDCFCALMFTGGRARLSDSRSHSNLSQEHIYSGPR